ncbi:phage holin family protein [Marinovum sp. 2_MG-2023]|uniref:phage holin family protein n=1 Tax=unclassified Marinovum TaxID=2647166 RepID=UPI0026E4782C|nr:MULTISPECIES: phage holin family protein [unclassified Marinovum]MDO6731510.1 phage holin family protein [Marinovum sp. 2_MG-2023]MDO6780870.1 phage holin family protein [Marinovum sp. 1_MG-2023]
MTGLEGIVQDLTRGMIHDGAAVARQEAKKTAAKAGALAAVWAVAIFLVCLSLVCAAFGLFFALNPVFGLVGAAFAVAGVAFVLALVLLLAVRLRSLTTSSSHGSGHHGPPGLHSAGAGGKSGDHSGANSPQAQAGVAAAGFLTGLLTGRG